MPPASPVGLERPPFGQCVRQVTGLRADLLADCLEYQRAAGGRLGAILRDRGLLTREQVADVLRFQAHWVAGSAHADLKPLAFPPYPAFLSLCMPAYNERSNIEDTLDSACTMLPAFVERFEVVVADDGSQDGTGDLVERYGRYDPRVRLVRHDRNRGYGAALTSALRAARGELVTFTDSDGQFSLLDLPQLLALLKGSDVVVGYRHQRADHWGRRFNASAWNWLVRTLLGVRVRDLDCAFKLFRRQVVDGLRLTATGAAINAEIMVQCQRGGLVVRETPVSHFPRYHGAPTGAALRVIGRAFRELPGLWKYRLATPPTAEELPGSVPVPVLTAPPDEPVIEVASASAVAPAHRNGKPFPNGHRPFTLPG